jgi:hypothetical protein
MHTESGRGVMMRCSHCRQMGHNARTCHRRGRVSTARASSSGRRQSRCAVTELNFSDVSLYIY